MPPARSRSKSTSTIAVFSRRVSRRTVPEAFHAKLTQILRGTHGLARLYSAPPYWARPHWALPCWARLYLPLFGREIHRPPVPARPRAQPPTLSILEWDEAETHDSWRRFGSRRSARERRTRRAPVAYAPDAIPGYSARIPGN